MVEFSKKDARRIAKGLKLAISKATSDGLVVMGCDALEYSPNHLLVNVKTRGGSGAYDVSEYTVDLVKGIAQLH